MAVTDILSITPIPAVIVDVSGRVWAMAAKGQVYADPKIDTMHAKILHQDLGKVLHVGIIITLIEDPGFEPNIEFEGQPISKDTRYMLQNVLDETINKLKN